MAGSSSPTVSWADLAKAAADPGRLPEGMEPDLDAMNDFETPDSSYPFGAHVAVVEVDTETGMTKLVRHVTVDDSGKIANPLLAEGRSTAALPRASRRRSTRRSPTRRDAGDAAERVAGD